MAAAPGSPDNSRALSNVENPAGSVQPRRQIFRVRTGCQTCRRRHLKCTEEKPKCKLCARRGLSCDYGPQFVFRDDTAVVTKKVSNIDQAPTRKRRRHVPTDRDQDYAPALEIPIASNSPTSISSPSPSAASRPQRRPSPLTHRDSHSTYHPSTTHLAYQNQDVVRQSDQVTRYPRFDQDYRPSTASSSYTGNIALCQDSSVAPDIHLLADTASHHPLPSPTNNTCNFDALVHLTTNLDRAEYAGLKLIPADTLERHLGPQPSDYDTSNLSSPRESSPASPRIGTHGTYGTHGKSPFPTPPEIPRHVPSNWKPNLGESVCSPDNLTATTGLVCPTDTGSALCDSFSVAGRGDDLSSIVNDDVIASSTMAGLLDDPRRQAQHLAYWRRDILPKLPAVFASITDMIDSYETIKLVVLGLSASRSAPLQAFTRHRRGDSTSINPDLREGFGYYSRTLKSFATRGLSGVQKLDQHARLVIMLLCSYFELAFGTVHGAICHIQQFDQLVDVDYDAIVQSAFGVRLILAWAGLRARLAADCLPFKPGTTFANTFTGSLIQKDIDRYIDLTSSDYTFLMLRLSSTSRYSDLMLLMTIVGPDATSPLFRKWIPLITQLYSDLPQDRLTTKSAAELYAILDTERQLLDDWYRKLPLSALPVDSHLSHDVEELDDQLPGFHLRPLRFASHQAAMNYAYYACAQLYASKRNIQYSSVGIPLRSLNHGFQQCDTAIDPWVLLVLRVLAGLDLVTSFSDNIFRLGAVWIAERVALRCHSLNALTWIENWLQKAEKLGGYWEGCHPVPLTRKFISHMVAEWHKGRAINLIYTDHDHYSEKQDLLQASFDTAKYRAVIHGFTIGSTSPDKDADASPQGIPFVDILTSDGSG